MKQGDDRPALDPAEVRTITVVRALGGLGDWLCAVPALMLLRERHPKARVRFIGMPALADVVARFPELVDEFAPFPGFPGVIEMPFDPQRLVAWLAAQGDPPDLAIQMHGSGSVTNPFTACLGARAMACFHVPGLWCPGPGSFAFPDHLSETDRWLELVRKIGCSGTAASYFPVTDADRAELGSTAAGLGARPYAVIHAGASQALRRWPAERFARVADLLAALGMAVVLTGVAGERDAVDAVRAAMRRDAIDLCGQTSLGATAALLERASLVVTNDTGISHLAAALATPSIVVFIASDPARWAPANRRLHRSVGRGVPDAVIGRPRPDTEPSLPAVVEVEAAIDAMLAVPA